MEASFPSLDPQQHRKPLLACWACQLDQPAQTSVVNTVATEASIAAVPWTAGTQPSRCLDATVVHRRKVASWALAIESVPDWPVAYIPVDTTEVAQVRQRPGHMAWEGLHIPEGSRIREDSRDHC